MQKKFLIPIAISIIAVLAIIFAVVYKQTSKDPFEDTKVIETLAPKETDEIITKVDKTESEATDLDFEVPTIATTEIAMENETKTVGITETLEDNSFIGVTPEKEVVATFNLPQLSSGHQYSEAEAVALDNLTYYWSENNISKEDLAMDFAEIQEQGFIPLYKREAITDSLHEVCGFRTDYQFISKSKMRTIQKKVKEKNKLLYSVTTKKIATHPSKHKGYSDFFVLQLSKIGL